MIGQQTEIFLCSLLLGGAVMAVYDLFRVLRLVFPGGGAAVFFQDILFTLTAGGMTWWFLMEWCTGQIRGYVLVGEFLGGMLYYFTLGQLVMTVAKPITRLLRWTAGWILCPVKLAASFVRRCLGKALEHLRESHFLRRRRTEPEEPSETEECFAPFGKALEHLRESHFLHRRRTEPEEPSETEKFFAP